MGHSNRLIVLWISTALASAVSCSINPQPEPPGLDVPTGSDNVGGATAVIIAAAGGFSAGLGGAMSAGGMQSAGGGNSADWTKGGAISETGSGDGGLREDASSGSDSGAAIDATLDASSSGSPPTDSQRK